MAEIVKKARVLIDEQNHARAFEPLTVTLSSSMLDSSLDDAGNIVLTFKHPAKLDYCPDMLHQNVHEWCARNRVDSEVLCSAMLDAATREAALSNLRDCLVICP